MDAAGKKLGLHKKRIQLPPKRKKRSIYSCHNHSGSQKGTNARACDTGDAAPAAAETQMTLNWKLLEMTLMVHLKLLTQSHQKTKG